MLPLAKRSLPDFGPVFRQYADDLKRAGEQHDAEQRAAQQQAAEQQAAEQRAAAAQRAAEHDDDQQAQAV